MGLRSCSVLLLACLNCAAFPQQSVTHAQQNPPALAHRPAANPEAPQGKIKIDVVVTDAAGQPVAGLTQQNFTLLDKQKPQPILFFHAANGETGTIAEPPVKVILLIDFANTTLQSVAYTRGQIESYLHQNEGVLAQPTTVMLFFDQKLKVLAGPSRNGNLLAKEIEQSPIAIHNIPLVDGPQMLERLSLSLRSLASIATAESMQPGRKLLIWIGPGWPMMDTPWYQPGTSSQKHLFSALVELSQELQEARITLYSIHPTNPAFNDATRVDLYRSYLQPVTLPRKLQPGNLALPVLAIHSGGLALNTQGNDLPSLIRKCIQDASAYYSLSFDPADVKHTDEYHEIHVEVNKPGLEVRTRAGYYAEPAFPH